MNEIISGIGVSRLNKNIIHITGNSRLAYHYYKHIIEPLAENKLVLDIGCGDGILGSLVANYIGVDIGAGCYFEASQKNILYLREKNQIIEAIQKLKPDISLLINVLEHTENFSDLFKEALNITSERVLVTLPNEENVHGRLGFLFGNGIMSHSLEMYGKHLNHRHLWLIQIDLACKILEKVAKENNFSVESRFYTISYPSTLWKRIIYRGMLYFLTLKLKSRSFGIVFKRNLI